ncbi:hypothetical protein [Gracilibacillus xinjiangensis]|uniref:SPOR domain-containing protein n=1 Tax=Gracilibacillus xinjiangensis TaxID=1193282 RepID=A0ABV8WXZ5_9BACI
MKNSNRISVHINQKKQEPKKDPIEHLLEKEKKPTNEEKSQPVYQPIHRPVKSGFWTTYRSFIYAALTAIVIGTFLGFIMLKIFVDMDPEEVSLDNNQRVNSVVTASEDVDTEEKSNDNPIFKSAAHQAFVVQAGVFSSESAATQLLNELKGSNIPAMIWQRDNQFHLFVSVHSTSDASKNYLKSITTDIEMYGGKAWTTVPVEISITESEKKWLESFDTLLPQLFESPDMKLLKEWLTTKPDNLSPNLTAFNEKIEQAGNKEQLDMLTVLEIWYQYSLLSNK